MNKIKSSNVLKGISFVLIPILVLILAFSIFHMLFLHEYGNESKEYTKTENFSTAYFRFVLNQVTRAQNVSSEESNNYLELEDENGKTRSGLVFDALRIIGDCKPKYAVCENVKNLTGKKFKAEFATILNILEEMGYNNYWKVLNAADYGVPQKRERVFIVSIRKDIDTGTFEFPKPFTLTKRLRDVLEDKVDEKYYLSEKLVNFFYENTLKNKAKGNGFAFNPVLQEEVGGVIAKTITTREGCRMENNFIKTIGYYQPSCHEASRVLDPDGIAPTVKENHGTVNAIKLDELTTGVSDAYRVYNADGLMFCFFIMTDIGHQFFCVIGWQWRQLQTVIDGQYTFF